MSSINYDDLIPNNVDLSSDRRLKRALEKWQPAFVNWWKEVGPQVFKNNEIYLRTAISPIVEAGQIFATYVCLNTGGASS